MRVLTRPLRRTLRRTCPARIVTANTAAAWCDALLDLAKEFPAQGNRLAEHPAFAARRPSVVAASLLDALTGVAVATAQPLTFHAVATPGIARRIERRVRRLRQRLFAKPGRRDRSP